MTDWRLATVLDLPGGLVAIGVRTDGTLAVSALGASDVCDELAWPPPLTVIGPGSSVGFITLEQLRKWGKAISDKAAIQAHELATVVEQWAKTHSLTKAETENENV